MTVPGYGVPGVPGHVGTLRDQETVHGQHPSRPSGRAAVPYCRGPATTPANPAQMRPGRASVVSDGGTGQMATTTPIDEYLATLDEPKRATLTSLRATIMAIVPEAAARRAASCASRAASRSASAAAIRSFRDAPPHPAGSTTGPHNPSPGSIPPSQHPQPSPPPAAAASSSTLRDSFRSPCRVRLASFEASAQILEPSTEITRSRPSPATAHT